MKKEFGIGSLSLVLFILAILWSASIKKIFCLGDIVLNSVNLPSWSNGNMGTHYTMFYAIVFLIPAIIVGHKFPNHIFAKAGKIVSIAWLCILLFSVLFIV
ncbi:hypothetical protein [Aminipila sp.]|uniref:hypothetical protein n=1 Tax=Aminipila sp. TaxID=2060095 RepID=UPI00289C24F4|nr:hypothetical protein [Aminipila sp.]